VTSSEFRDDLDIHKTRMNGLSCGKESMTIYSAVLIQSQRVTDGRTDVQPISMLPKSKMNTIKMSMPYEDKSATKLFRKVQRNFQKFSQKEMVSKLLN